MAEAGDLIEEFKKAKPPEKTVIILAVVVIGGIAIYYFYTKSQQAASTAAQGTTTQGGGVAGYPTVGSNQTPVLPSGVNPIYDPNGNLVAFQNQPTPTTTGNTGTQPTTTALNWFQQAFGLKPEITNQNGTFSLVQRGAGNKIISSTQLSTLFPTGTTFSGAGGGYAYANIPGQSTPFQLTAGGYGRPNLIPSSTTTAKTAASSTH